ncbi:MAG: hypothetical protein HC933_06315 [Pleurocapsa sp. SU_196_0]|nr:hypothetical protein [Pleurocapsa sp. SU_196_0]
MLEVLTTEPGVQSTADNFLDGKVKGKRQEVNRRYDLKDRRAPAALCRGPSSLHLAHR